MNHRLEHLRAAMRERELEALLISEAANRRYISGFGGSAGTLLVTAEQAILITDFRYRSRAAEEAPAFEVRQVSLEKPLPKLLAQVVGELGIQQLGFEAAHVSVAQYQKFLDVFDDNEAPIKPEMLSVGEIVETLRQVKDAAELTTLRHAVTITDAALEAVLPTLRPEHSERHAAWMLEVAMRERGAEGVSFPIIVAAGRKSAMPHAEPGDEPLGSGQPIVIDMGARYAGYHADLTRTVVLGTPDERFRQIYNTVLDAQQHAIRELRPGLSGPEADALARSKIEAAGFKEAFGHSLGHGVGLHIHEGPSLSQSSKHTLRAGNVFSVEPGIYLDDWGGIRIEDLALLHEHGCEVLSQAPKMQP